MENYDFYKNLKEEDKKYLFDNSKYIELPKNFTLFYQGDICNDILLLKEGTVQLMMYGSINELIPLYEIQFLLLNECFVSSVVLGNLTLSLANPGIKTFSKQYS